MLNRLDDLGKRGRDKVTGAEGVITSVVFDLYGCVQMTLVPGKGPDGKLQDANWFDAHRIEIIDHNPVMPRPTFAPVQRVEDSHGPESSRPCVR